MELDMDLEKFYNDIRNMTISTNNLQNVDDAYTFYYDETNNIRKFTLRNGSTNNSTFDNFVLGGVMHKGDKPSSVFSELKNSINLPDNTNEIKFKHIARGAFDSCLKSPELSSFLSWLESSNLYVHYTNINILFWSIVDIIDSVELTKEEIQLTPILKSVFYDAINSNRDAFIKLLDSFEYPNIKSHRAEEFILSLIEYMDINKTNAWHVLFSPMLRKILIRSTNLKDLPFINNETDKVLINNFVPFYIQPIYLFKNSNINFDCEETIQELLNNDKYAKSKISSGRVQFLQSHEVELIQVSDIVTGLLGKYFSYLNHINIENIQTIKNSMNKFQTENLKRLSRIFDKAEAQSAALAHSVQSISSEMKHERFMDFS